MNWKLKMMLWFVNQIQPIRQAKDDEIEKTRKINVKVAALGNFLHNSKINIKEINDFTIDGIPVRLYKNSSVANQKVIIYAHGGGFVYYNIDSHDYVTRRLCAMNDCIVISVEYRLAPEHSFPAAHEDYYKVIEYVHQHSEALGIDKNKIIVAGDSAGGNLAACASHHFKQHPTIRIAAQVLVYPWLDGRIANASIEKYKTGYLLTKEAMLWFQQKYTPKPEDKCNPEVSPIHHTNFIGLPPAFVITAEYDPLKDEGMEYASKLKEAGCQVLYKDYKALVHGFFNIPKVSDDAMQCYYDVQAFLKKLA